MPLPVAGTWQLQYYFGAPAYDRKASDEERFPSEGTGPPSVSDSITGVVGGVDQAFRSLPAVQVSGFLRGAAAPPVTESGMPFVA